ncbi:response regulator FixJ [Brevundimonas terrae]|uniref:Response regulator FixJ n=1 Tax=Brevundimonas terrae TaxID=363631 RepID=A0ABP3I444_9CAUL|nr:response regulator [Brevundimonas terrae]NIJ27683.1 two-component system response regulator FixJ [Brevundimonas terrae]
MTPSVFIIDDDAGMRDSLVALLRSQGIRCRAFAGGADFFRSMPQDETACVVTDLRMPEVDGAELVRRINEERGAAWPILVITAHADVSVAVSLMKQGVVDFIEKPFDPQRLIESVRGCLSRLTQVGEQQRLTQSAREKYDRLTPREAQVFNALIEGLSNKAIAQTLDISPRTVEVFRAKVMQKIEAESLSDLIKTGLLLRNDDGISS